MVQVDIEGSEFELFDDFFKQARPMPFSEILIELHVPKLGTGAAQTWGENTPTRMKCALLPMPSHGELPRDLLVAVRGDTGILSPRSAFGIQPSQSQPSTGTNAHHVYSMTAL